MKSVKDIPVLENIPVLVRAALNEPVADGVVQDSYRLQRALPTIRYLSERHARVILISHIDNQNAPAANPSTATLKPVADALAKMLPGVAFCSTTTDAAARMAIRDVPAGGILVLENVRRNRGEILNDPAFARELALLADVFVQDSFDTCHRTHASIVGIPALLPSYAGLLLEDEIAALTGALEPSKPSLAIIGGAKFGTKEAVLERLLALYSQVFVGGALANDFLKASGHEVGQSLVSEVDPAQMRKVLANPRLVLPIDSLVVPKEFTGAKDARSHARLAGYGEVRPEDVILDHGPGTGAILAGITKSAKTILWNGPLGMYERGFTDATDALAEAVAASSAHSVIGGGDTITAIEKLNILGEFSFVSTGGGAMLEFLAKGTLPGIEVLG